MLELHTTALVLYPSSSSVQHSAHHSLPTHSPQESGRAGRDGLPSESLVLTAADDLDTSAALQAQRGGQQGQVVPACSLRVQGGRWSSCCCVLIATTVTYHAVINGTSFSHT